ncbi:nestin [Monodelphis domestica]|uniref:nestin n=1 Tax=Monodelphis domestica TaxID=13616 RepID=UPI0024E1BD5B|nr:nestin [Monodelphis domestica]
MMESCLGEESVQMWELNRRLEAYLSRVKSLEEQNERLRLEIGNLREQPGEPSWRSQAEEELGALRALLDQRWSEKHAAEVARDNLLEEVEGVASRCQQQLLARERAKEQVAESRRVLEAEKWAGVCLGNQAAELEKELEALVAAHEQERAGMSAQVARSALGLETFRRAPDNAPAPDVQDLARTFGDAWRGAVEGYQARVACMEASLGQARERLGQAMQGTREGQREAQRLGVERAALQGRREMLEQRLEGQWQEQQEAGEKFQLAVEALEQEKQDLHNQIAQVLEDRQQLTHLKMSLSLEVATYRTLLEAESSRLNTSNIDSKATIIFPDPKMELCIPVTPEIRHPGPWPPVLSPTSLPMVDTPRTPMPAFLKSQGFLPTQTPTLASTPIPAISQAHHPGTGREVQGQVASSYLLQGPSYDGPKLKDSEHLTVPKLPWAKAKVGIGMGSSPEPEEPAVEKQQVLSFPCPDELVEQVEDKKIVLATDSSIDPLAAKDGEEKDGELNDISSPQPPAPEPSKYQEKVGKEIQGVAEEEDETKETIAENLEEKTWQKGGALDKEEIQERPGTSDEKVQETFGILSGKIRETLNLPGEEVQKTQKLPSEEFQEMQILPGEEIQETQRLPDEKIQETHIFPGEEIQKSKELPTEEFQEIQILPGKEVQETQKLPNEEFQEIQILPDELIQETQKLPDEEIQDTHIFPGEEIQKSKKLPTEEFQDIQILLGEEIQETQKLPSEEGQETQILPDEEIQETQILPDEEIQETQSLPSEKIQETLILPGEEIQGIQNLQTDENQEILSFPGEDKQEIMMPLEKETQETLRSLEDNEETLNSPKEGNLEIGENQETIGFPGEKKQETLSPLEEGVLEKKENQETLGSPKENNQEIVSSPEEGDLERENNQEIQGPPEENNEEIPKPQKGDLEREEEKSGSLKEEIQGILCFSEEGNQERGEMQEIPTLPEKEIQESLTSLDEGNLETEENQEIPEEGKGALERKENQEILQSLEVESLDLQKPEDVAGIGQDCSIEGDEKAPWETGKDHEETAKRKPEEQSSLEGNWEVVEEAGLRYGGPGESQHAGEEELGSQESEQQRFPTKETIKEGITTSPQVEFREVESTEFEALNCVPKMSEQMFEEDGSSRESDGEAPEDNGSITGLEPLEGEEVRNQEQLKKEVSESENWEGGLSEPHHREVILEPSLEQSDRETEKDVQETNELNQQYSKLLMENETPHPHLETPEVLEKPEQKNSLGMGEDSRHPSDLLPAETTIANNVDGGTTTQSSFMGQGGPQEIKQEVDISEDPLESHFRAEGNKELWESWETEGKTEVSEELVKEIGKVNAKDSSTVFQEEVEESEGDDLSETLPDSTPLGLYSREPDSPSWGMIAKEHPSPQEEHNDEPWDPPPRHTEVSRAQPDEGEDEDGAPDSDVSEEFEDLAVDASLLPGGPGRLMETVGPGSELVLDPPTWDRDRESDGFADEEESGEEEEDGDGDDDDDDDDDDDNDERVEGTRHWKLGPSLGSPVSYHQEGEPEEDRERNAHAPSDAGRREGAENFPPAILEVEKETKPLDRPKSLDSDIQSDSEEEHSHVTEDPEDSGPNEEELETPLPSNQSLFGVSDPTLLDKEDQASDSDLIEIPCRVDDSARKAGTSLNGGGPTMDQPDDIRGDILNGLGKLQEADQGKLWDLEREGGEGKAPGEELSSQTLWSGGPLILGQSPFLKFTQTKEEDRDSWSSGDE